MGRVRCCDSAEVSTLYCSNLLQIKTFNMNFMIYRIALIFRGSKFSRIAALKEFVE